MSELPKLAGKPKSLHAGNAASVRGAHRRAAERRSWLREHCTTCTISEAAVQLDATAPVLRKDCIAAGITMMPEDKRVKPNHRYDEGTLRNVWLRRTW